MKRNMIKRIALAACSLMLLVSVPAYANTSQKGEEDMEPAVIVEVNTTPIATAAPDIQPTTPPFSVPGNGAVLDDLPDGNKEFYTIQTANNNTFYLVVDKASTSQNVYMLAKINEDDLAEFMDSIPTPSPAPTPSIIIQQPTMPPIQTEVVPDKTDNSASSYMLILGIALAAAAAAVYFKIIKPRQDENDDDSEGMEYDDDSEEE